MPGVIVIGGGLAGLTSAYYLRQAGYDVVVLEKNDTVGQETSYANGGLLTPSMSEPWNAPGVQWDLIRSIGRADAAILVRITSLHHYIGWGLRFLAHSSPKRYRLATLANLSLATLSLSELKNLRESGAVEYTHDTRGTMKVFRSRDGFEAALDAASLLTDSHLRFEGHDASGAVNVEPALAEIESEIAGGIFYPMDETGDALEFCRSLANTLTLQGGDIRFNTVVTGIHADRNGVKGVWTTKGKFDAGIVVVASGPWAQGLLAGVGQRVHVKPVKGYSVSVPLQLGSYWPKVAILDTDLHVGATRLGNFLRLAGTAEFCGFDSHLDPLRIDNLFSMLEVMCPTLSKSIDRDSAVPWCGFRPMSADGCPYIGESTIPGLWLNVGHGHLGWTQAPGSAALLSKQISGDEMPIDSSPFAVLR